MGGLDSPYADRNRPALQFPYPFFEDGSSCLGPVAGRDQYSRSQVRTVRICAVNRERAILYGSAYKQVLAMLRVLGRSSSINVRKVLWTCEELALPYEREDWGTGFRSTATPEFKALNPNALVPVIQDGPLVLWESNTICRYLTAKAGRTDLLPADPAARAAVEQWMDWQATELNTAWRYAFMSLVRQSADHQNGEAILASVDSWNRHMEILERQLSKTTAYICGAHFTLADIIIGLSTHRWLMTPMNRPELPSVSAYYERLSERPGFRLHGRNGIP